MKEDILPSNIMEISINNFKHNIREIKNYLNKDIEIMPIMKANAYGTYLNTKLDILNLFNIIGVANTYEGIYLRNIGYQKDIFILNQPSIQDIDLIIENNLTIGISNDNFIDELKKRNKAAKIHIEIDTGMGRTGINYKNTLDFIKKIKDNKNIIIEGIYTHLSSADIDDEFTKKQLNEFEIAVRIIKENINTIKYIHSCASNGIINYSNTSFNLVRPGIIMYGFKSCDDTYKKLNLKPVCTLKSKITFLKTVPSNTSIGYGRSYITNKTTKIATIPIGYADGIRRCLSNKGQVLIKGQYAKIIGNICMDNLMVDVTNIDNVSLEDAVYIWDNDKITIDDIAKLSYSINYEILCTIGTRVYRKFI